MIIVVHKIEINSPFYILKNSLDDISSKTLSHFINISFLRLTIQPKMGDLTNDVVIFMSTSLNKGLDITISVGKRTRNYIFHVFPMIWIYEFVFEIEALVFGKEI